MNNNRRYTFNDDEVEHFKEELVHIETNIEEMEEEFRLVKESLFRLKQRKDGLIAHNPILARKKIINRKPCRLNMITRNGQRYDADTMRLLQGVIIGAYTEMEYVKNNHPHNYKKLASAATKFTTKHIYDIVKKLDGRVLQRGEKALRRFISRNIRIFENRDKDIKIQKTDAKTCREAYNCWHIKLHMD